MFSRMLSVPLLLGAAVGVPYVATNGTSVEGLFGSSRASKSQSLDAQAELLTQSAQKNARPSMPQGPGATIYPNEIPLEGLPTMSLHEVFDLNVTKEWVYQRWARKSTALSELGLFGIRVPLVTGTQMYDLAGSLTYFYGNDGRVSRISFHGTTGDTTQLVMLAAQQFGLQPQATPVAGEQLYQIRRQNQIFSELRTRPAPVLWSSSPHDSFAVDFELQRPEATTPLPSRLPPLPKAKAPVETSAKTPAESKAGKSAASEAIDPEQKWKPFFPRSRVPKKQVDGLETRGRMW